MTILPTKYGIGKMPDQWQDPFNLPPLAKTIGGNQTMGQLDKFLTSPGGGMLMNLLAQSGYSTMPQSPFGAIGKAALMTRQQSMEDERAGLENELIKSRIGLNQASTASGGSIANVARTFEGDNGNMWVITRNGETRDTGVPFSNSVQLVEQADGTTVAVNRRTGQVVGTPITSEDAAEAATRESQREKAFTLPTELVSLDSIIAASDSVIEKIEDIMPLTESAGIPVTVRGNLPGELGGDPRKLKQRANSLKANFGFDTLQKMRAASKSGGALGQVSERELDLLINAVQSIDVEGEPEELRRNLNLVVKHYQNYKREIEKLKNAMRKEAGQSEVKDTRPLSDYSDEELLEIIRNADNP